MIWNRVCCAPHRATGFQGQRLHAGWQRGQVRASLVAVVAHSDRAQAAETREAGRSSDALPADWVHLRRKDEVVDLQQRPQRGDERILRSMPHAAWSLLKPSSIMSPPAASILYDSKVGSVCSHDSRSASLPYTNGSFVPKTVLAQYNSTKFACAGNRQVGVALRHELTSMALANLTLMQMPKVCIRA